MWYTTDMKKLKVISRAVIVHEDKLLLVKNHKRDFWSLPGGHWELDYESLGSCAVREVEEETGFLTELNDIIFVQELRKPESVVIEVFWSGTIAAENTRDIQSKIQHIDIDEDSEIDKVAWFDKSSIKDIRVVPNSIVRHFLGNAGEKDPTFIGTFELDS
jgi:ADP-ribose pyrophosphatase YjhB (NUDIX family)